MKAKDILDLVQECVIRDEEMCICSSCGEKVFHELGTPCNKIACPKCGQLMIREID